MGKITQGSIPVPKLGAIISPDAWEAVYQAQAERALERGEGGAQLEIKDEYLREALLTSIIDELRALRAELLY
jgi:hypothetical protein